MLRPCRCSLRSDCQPAPAGVHPWQPQRPSSAFEKLSTGLGHAVAKDLCRARGLTPRPGSVPGPYLPAPVCVSFINSFDIIYNMNTSTPAIAIASRVRAGMLTCFALSIAPLYMPPSPPFFPRPPLVVAPSAKPTCRPSLPARRRRS